MQFETDRLVIRPLTKADAAPLRAMIFDSRVVAYLRYQTVKTSADFEQILQDHFLADRTTTFGLERKRDHQLIGFYEFHVTGTTAALTYALSPAAWGAGYVAEAGRRLMTYGFEQLGLERIEAHFASVNPRSGRVMAKMGMHDEGELKTVTITSGERVHVMMYALSRADWQRASA